MRAERRSGRWLGLAACLCLALLPGVRAAGAGDAGAAPPPDDIVSPSLVGEVRFPHSLHADELGFECTECHHETDAGPVATPHPVYFEDSGIDCGSCHREQDSPRGARSCGACHHDSPATTADETLSAKVVIHRSCWNCHDSGTGEAASRSCGFCHAGRPAPAQEAP